MEKLSEELKERFESIDILSRKQYLIGYLSSALERVGYDQKDSMEFMDKVFIKDQPQKIIDINESPEMRALNIVLEKIEKQLSEDFNLDFKFGNAYRYEFKTRLEEFL